MIHLGITDLTFHHATGAVVAALLEHLGYSVRCSHAPHEENFERLRQGQIDMLASAWLPSSHGLYLEQVQQSVATRELGLHYQPYALWGVPDYVPQSEVAEIADLLRPAVRARMTPVIQGIGPGAGITRFSQQIMQDYGLTDAGYRFLTGTQAQCIEAIETAIAERRWAVVPLWQPQFLHAQHRLRELHEPLGLLGGIDRAVLLAREDRLQHFSPQHLQVLDNIRLSNAQVAELDLAINRGGLQPQAAAQAWQAANPRTFGQWLEPIDG